MTLRPVAARLRPHKNHCRGFSAWRRRYAFFIKAARVFKRVCFTGGGDSEPGVRLHPEGPLSFQKSTLTYCINCPCCKGYTGFLSRWVARSSHNLREQILKFSVRGGRTDAGIKSRRERIGVVFIHRCTRPKEECSSCHWKGSSSRSLFGLVALPSLNSPPFPGNAGHIVFRSHSSHPQMSWNWQRQLFTS